MTYSRSSRFSVFRGQNRHRWLKALKRKLCAKRDCHNRVFRGVAGGRDTPRAAARKSPPGGEPGVGHEGEHGGAQEGDDPGGEAFEGVGGAAMESVSEEVIKRYYMDIYR